MDNPQALYSLEAEQSLIGAIMLSESAWDEAADILTANDFVRAEHQAIWNACKKLADKNQPRDALTVSEKLKEFDELELAGGLIYLGDLVKNTVGTYNVKTYAEIISHRSKLRQLLSAARDTAEEIENPNLDLADKVSRATERLDAVLAAASPEDGYTAKDAIREWLEFQIERANAGTSITGIRTGFPDLDKAIRGLNKKHLVVLAARPSMGKSTLAVNIARNILKDGGSVYLSTMEMSSVDVMNQLCACHAGANYEIVQDAKIDCDEFISASSLIADAMTRWKYFINDKGTQTVASIRRGVKRHIRIHGPSVLIVDYAQLVSERGENEVNRIGLISRGMKQIAQDFNIPVILLSQLSRKCEERPDKRPMLSDLRGSGDIEQDASEVLFLYDDAVYNPASTSGAYTELIIAKNRHGKRGIVLPLLKQLDRARFLTPDQRDMREDWRALAANQEPRKQSRPQPR